MIQEEGTAGKKTWRKKWPGRRRKKSFICLIFGRKRQEEDQHFQTGGFPTLSGRRWHRK